MEIDGNFHGSRLQNQKVWKTENAWGVEGAMCPMTPASPGVPSRFANAREVHVIENQILTTYHVSICSYSIPCCTPTHTPTPGTAAVLCINRRKWLCSLFKQMAWFGRACSVTVAPTEKRVLYTHSVPWYCKLWPLPYIYKVPLRGMCVVKSRGWRRLNRLTEQLKQL